MTREQIEQLTRKLIDASVRDPEREHPGWAKLDDLLARILAGEGKVEGHE